MADHRFYSRMGPFTLGELANLINADLNNVEISGRTVTDVGPLNTASQEELSFLDNPKYISEFKANVDFAVDLGIKGVRVDCVQPPTIHKDLDFDTLFSRLTSTWDTCINYAAD